MSEMAMYVDLDCKVEFSPTDAPEVVSCLNGAWLIRFSCSYGFNLGSVSPSAGNASISSGLCPSPFSECVIPDSVVLGNVGTEQRGFGADRCFTGL